MAIKNGFVFRFLVLQLSLNIIVPIHTNPLHEPRKNQRDPKSMFERLHHIIKRGILPIRRSFIAVIVSKLNSILRNNIYESTSRNHIILNRKNTYNPNNKAKVTLKRQRNLSFLKNRMHPV